METNLPIGALRTTLGDLARKLGGTLEGPADLPIERLTSAESADPKGIAFAEAESYVSAAKKVGVAALLLPPDLDSQGIPAIRVDVPRMAFFRLLMESDRPIPFATGVHPTAVVDPTATVSPEASVGAYAVIEAYARIEAGARVYAHAYVGEFSHISTGASVMPHAVLVRNVTVGPGATVQSGSVLGADGFGFVWDGTQRVKIPQVGRVRLDANVEIGALTAVDRATAGETVVGEGTKIDNLVQVGHNTQIGKHGAIAGLTGISGSARVGDRVVMGGQVAVVDHKTVGDDIMLAGRSGVSEDITEPGGYFGAPARPAVEAMRAFVLLPKIGELFSKVRKMERRLASLEAKSGDSN